MVGWTTGGVWLPERAPDTVAGAAPASNRLPTSSSRPRSTTARGVEATDSTVTDRLSATFLTMSPAGRTIREVLSVLARPLLFSGGEA